jgi:hypothetical protein
VVQLDELSGAFEHTCELCGHPRAIVDVSKRTLRCEGCREYLRSLSKADLFGFIQQARAMQRSRKVLERAL